MPTQTHQNPLNADPNLYVLQDSRSNADHQTLFWAKGGAGYTTDVRNAHLFTEDEATHQHRARSTDIPHRVGDLAQSMRLTVEDTQLNYANYEQRKRLLNDLDRLANHTTDPVEQELARITYRMANDPEVKSAFEVRTIVRESGLPLEQHKSTDQALYERANEVQGMNQAMTEPQDVMPAPDDDGPRLG